MGTQHTLQWLLVLESWQEKTNGKLLHLDLGQGFVEVGMERRNQAEGVVQGERARREDYAGA